MFQDRRQYQRLTPSSPQLVLLDESKYSLLFDLCEGGLAVEGLAARKSPDVFSLEFDLPAGNGCIQAKAQIVWTSDSGYRTGFRFVELEDSYREQLKAWISTDLAARLAMNGAEALQALFSEDLADDVRQKAAADTVLTRTSDKAQPRTALFPLPTAAKWEAPAGSENEALNGINGERTPAYVAGIILALVMSSVSFLMGYYWRGARVRSRISQPSSAAPSLRAPAAAAMPGPDKANPSPATAPSMAEPGFVLQVGAMDKETNADALSASLHQKNFSAFVFKRGSDRFYRVVVGPFPDRDSAAKVQGDLETQGFKPLLKPWAPE